MRVAVRFSGPSVAPAVEVQRLVSSWEAQCARDGTDPAIDLERAPWLEVGDDWVDVVFVSRAGNRRWRRWESSFMRWVHTFSGEMLPTAMVDYVRGEVSVMGGVSRNRPMPPGVGPVNNEHWTPGQGAEAVPMLYREMMNKTVSPFMRSAGYRRKGQEFEKQRHGYNAYVGFQKSVYNSHRRPVLDSLTGSVRAGEEGGSMLTTAMTGYRVGGRGGEVVVNEHSSQVPAPPLGLAGWHRASWQATPNRRILVYHRLAQPPGNKMLWNLVAAPAWAPWPGPHLPAAESIGRRITSAIRISRRTVTMIDVIRRSGGTVPCTTEELLLVAGGRDRARYGQLEVSRAGRRVGLQREGHDGVQLGSTRVGRRRLLGAACSED